jgi:hypothetical protein
MDGQDPANAGTPQAILLGSKDGGPASIRCRTDVVTALGVRVVVSRALEGGVRVEAQDPQGLLGHLQAVLGENMRLGLVSSANNAWCGPVRLVGAQAIDDDPASFMATFAYVDPLLARDRERLGLPAGARVAAATGESPPSRRLAERVDVSLPVDVETVRGPVTGRVIDASRSGLRVDLAAEDLGFPPTHDMSELARGVGAALAPCFRVRIDHEGLGVRLQRSVRMTRLSVSGSEEAIEVGVVFAEPLTLEETIMVGVALPPPVDSDEIWPTARETVHPRRRRFEAAAPHPSEVLPPEGADIDVDEGSELRLPQLGFVLARRFRAFLRCAAGGTSAPIVGHTDAVGPGGVRVRLVNAPGVTAAAESRNVARVTEQFTEVYGTEVTLKLVDGAAHLWTGPARLSAIQLPPDRPGETVLTLGFVRTLRPAEVRRLGLGVLAG